MNHSLDHLELNSYSFSFPCSDSDYLYSPFCANALTLSLSKNASYAF